MNRKKPTSEIAVEVVNIGVPLIPNEKNVSSSVYTDFIPFGSDNLFPQALALITRRSAVQRAIITNKAFYILGRGFSYDEKNKALESIVKLANANETLHEVTRKVIIDKISFGNAFIELVKVGGVLSIFHQDATYCRINKNGDKVVINPNWSKYDKKKSIEIPLYPKFDKGRSMIHIKDYEPEFKTYGIPQWVASLDASVIAYKTNKWNLSRLDNSFQSSGVLLVDGNISQDDAVKLKKKFKEEFTGEGNQGKVMFIAQNLGGNSSTKWTPISSANEGDWMNLHKQSNDELIVANNWFPSLSGVATAGQLGNTQQIRNEYQIALNTVINYEQMAIINVYRRVLSQVNNIDATSLTFINQSPVSIIDRVDLNSAIKKWEVRKLAGLDYDENDEEQMAWNTVGEKGGQNV